VAGTLRTRLVTHVSGVRRILAAFAGLLLVGGLAAYTGVTGATAAPAPSISQVQAQVNALTTKFDRADQQYDEVAEQLATAHATLQRVNKEVARDQAQFSAARMKVAQIAAAAYENAGQTSLAGLLTTNNPSEVLNQASMLLQLAGSSNQETQVFLADAQQLKSVQQEQQRTTYGISVLAAQRAQVKNSIAKLLANEKATLDSLTTQQQQQVDTGPGSGGGSSDGGGGVIGSNYHGPTSTQAEKAIEYAYAQLGCPYVYGATGPCQDGFDCSGLVMEAWAYAGVSIPRDTYEQWAALPHIPESDIEPGDLLYFNGIGHVGMYVGDGYLIDSPQPGQDVEKVSFDEPWFQENFDGAARP
jgi:peptidoglycan DL-endopeptidase CwlO